MLLIYFLKKAFFSARQCLEALSLALVTVYSTKRHYMCVRLFLSLADSIAAAAMIMILEGSRMRLNRILAIVSMLRSDRGFANPRNKTL